MSRGPQIGNTEQLRLKLIELLHDLPVRLTTGTVGEQVGSLVEVNLHLRALGATIGASLAMEQGNSGRARLLAYLRAQVGRIVHTDELLIVAGIGDYPRRIRELRANFGWPIISGMAVRDMRTIATSEDSGPKISKMAPDEYMLIEDARDEDAIRRWQEAAHIRDNAPNIGRAILEYLQRAPNRRVTAEELRYVSGNSSQWPAALHQLRVEGFNITSKDQGDNELPWGLYVFQGTR